MAKRERKLESPQIKTLDRIEGLVEAGRMIVTEQPKLMITTIFETIKSRDSATFYVSPEVYSQVMKRYWTPARISRVGLEKISPNESKRIKQEFSLDMKGASFAPFDCQHCGHRYGMFEFVEQGIAQHGKSFVDNVLRGRKVAIVRVNQSITPICPNCGFHAKAPKKKKKEEPGGCYYWCTEYGCCWWSG